jgi:hypothetical protein
MKKRICASRLQLLFALALSAQLAAVGCGSSNNPPPATPPPGLATPAPAGNSNSYYGPQSPADMWQASIDHTNNLFTAQDLTNPSQGVITGAFSIQSPTDFLTLAQTNVSPPFQQFGYALEIPGRVLLLRPGTNTTALAAMAPGTCLSINGTATFQFVALVDKNWASKTSTAYGSVQVATNASTWSFSNFSQYTLSSSMQPGTTLAAGTCGNTMGNTAITIPPPTPDSTGSAAVVGPSGFFVSNQLLTDPSSGNQFGAVGTIQPSSAIDTGSVRSATYYGFMFEPAVSSRCVGTICSAPTQMVTFNNAGCPSGVQPSPTAICGAVFQQDVLTGPQQDLLIDLGTEDQSQFGLYKSATIQVPDPNRICSLSGMCMLPAIAVVGNPEGQFAIFLIAQDSVNDSPLLICLLQQ